MRVEYGDDEVVMPAVDLDDLKRAVESDRAPLARLSIDDITIFFDEVSNRWRDPDNEWRRIAIEWGQRISGYARDTVEADVNFLSGALVRAELYDMLETDVGDPALLDEWTRNKAVYQRCWPQGVVAHVMVGNVPMAGLFTIVRSLLTKNVTIAKVSSRDVVIPQCFAQCIYDTDPDHPVSRALTTCYWEPDSAVENLVLDHADVVTIWGRTPSIASVKSRLRPGTDLIEFGPKRSLSVLLPGIDDWDRVGLWVGLDVIAYNQEGCFSTQEAFVVGDGRPFAESLATWLARYERSVPMGATTVDADAHVQRARLDAKAMGWEVMAPDGTDWTVVLTDGPCRIDEHPLRRFLYVHPVESFTDVLPFIDENVQTVSVEPLQDAQWDIADELTSRGADRIVAIGRTARMRPGFIHDGFRPMSRMVRWSAVERGTDYKYRFSYRSVQEVEQAYRSWASGEPPSSG